MSQHQSKVNRPKSSSQQTKASSSPHSTSPCITQGQLRPAQILRLQSLIGNHAVQRFLSPALMFSSAAHQARISQEILQLVADGNSRMPVEYVQAKIGGAVPLSEGLQGAYQQAIREVLAGEPDAQNDIIANHAMRILRLIEHQFIHDSDASTLDLLPNEEGDKYREFKWQDNDYPGDKATLDDGTPNPKKGKNEGKATRMAGALNKLFPEMRANSKASGVVLQSEFESQKALREFIKDQLVTVPAQGRKRLNRTATDAFVQMHQAALEDGVELTILAAYRSPETSKKRAKKIGNPAAVADFSAHNLGLAMDLRMSTDDQKFKETSTKMPNVVKMRQAPAHKWLFLNADRFGWYPYRNEPWHWEYNPPGFREQFHEEAKTFWEARELSK